MLTIFFQIVRQSVAILAPILKKREEIISLPSVKDDFWLRVFANAPPAVEDYVLDDDAAILGEGLKGLTVEHFELDAQGKGEPRSLRFTFEFDPEENSYFDNAKLVKEFHWRKQVLKTSSGKRRVWEGLVSDPVRINWKNAELDPTKGLLTAACDLFDAEKKNGGDRKKLPEYAALVKKIELVEAEAMKDDEDMDDEDVELPEDEDESPAGLSFFNFFGYRGRDVSAEQNKEAIKEDEERWAKISKGEEVPEDDDDEDDEDEDFELLADDLEDAEIFTDGEEVAMAIAQDLWPNALKYYGMSNPGDT